MDETEDDLYGDIDESPSFPASSSFEAGAGAVVAAAAPATSDTVASGQTETGRPRSLVEEVKYLQAQVGQLQTENENLKRNMGTLFRTARAEIQRKDKEILRLTAELDQPAPQTK